VYIALYNQGDEAATLLRGGGIMCRVFAAIVLMSAFALMSGCMHVSPLWPLKVDAQTARVQFG
jgi:hypothetical protein